MKPFKIFTNLAILAALSFAGCKEERTGLEDAPDKAKVAIYNVASQFRTPHLPPPVPVRTLSFFLNIDGNRIFSAPLRSLNTTGYILVDPGTRTFRADSTLGSAVTITTPGPKAGTSISLQDAAPVLTTPLSVAAGKFYSLFLYGNVQSPSKLFVEDDLTRPAAGKARIRVINLSPDLPSAVDMAIAKAGENPLAFSNLASSVAFEGVSTFNAIDAGLYTVQLRATGSTTPMMTRTTPGQNNGLAAFPSENGSDVNQFNMLFESGKVYTLVVRGYSQPANVDSKGVRLSVGAVYNLYF